ncbi:unnamed protein product, partial [Rotaria sp. Silwood1]
MRADDTIPSISGKNFGMPSWTGEMPPMSSKDAVHQ